LPHLQGVIEFYDPDLLALLADEADLGRRNVVVQADLLVFCGDALSLQK